MSQPFTFGAPAPASTSTSLFGNSGTTQAPAQTKSLFGGFSTPNPQQQQQPGTGSLFGNQPAQNQSANPAPFTFGTSTANSGGAAQQTSGGMFGQQQQQQQPQTSSLFGGAQAKPPGTGLFGSTTSQPAQPSTSMFGAPAPGQQPQQPSTGLFGSTQQQPQGQSGLFGSTAQAQPQTSSLFGSTPQTQQTQPLGQSMFSFGGPAQPQQQLQAQGQTPLNNSLFASTSGAQNVLGASLAPNQRQEVDIGERMTAVQRAWDSSSPECRFKYFFYNVVEPGQAQHYGRPTGANDEAKWIKALRENPDPTRMVPVLATGWADVKKRAAMQEQIASVHQQKVKELTQALNALSRQSALTTSIRLSALQTHLTQLQHRLVRLAAQSPAFIPALQGSALRPEEIETKRVLEGVKAEVDGKRVGAGGLAGKGGYGLAGRAPGTPGKGGGAKMLGQVNELWGQVEEIRRYRGRRQMGETEGWLNDERALGEVAEVLATQQNALQKLNDLANNAIFDADVMRQGLGLVSSHERHRS